MSQIVQRSSDPIGSKEESTLPRGNSLDQLVDQSSLLAEVYAPIAKELVEVEGILQRELKSDAPWVEELLEHSRLLGGKRMRPVFLLLSGACCGVITHAHLQLAASLEMIHTATLIHDDVLDHAETRRHLPTANSCWGNKVSVLLGDYLFTHAFHLATFADSPVALRFLAAATNRVCGGEMRQNVLIGNFDLSEEEYLRLISEKTAELCSCGCYLGALLSGAPEKQVARFEAFGRDLGIAFQIIDDILDLVGHATLVGKTLGTDIANRKPTLPVIHSLANLKPQQRTELIKLLESDQVSVDDVIPVLRSTGSIEFARNVATVHGTRASEFANQLPESEYANALKNMARFVLQRNH